MRSVIEDIFSVRSGDCSPLKLAIGSSGTIHWIRKRWPSNLRPHRTAHLRDAPYDFRITTVRERLMKSRLLMISTILATAVVVSGPAGATTTSTNTTDAQAHAAGLLSGARTVSTSKTQTTVASSSAVGDAHKHAAALLSGVRSADASSDVTVSSNSVRERGSSDAHSHAAGLLMHGANAGR
jgi:hypothetical protein